MFGILLHLNYVWTNLDVFKDRRRQEVSIKLCITFKHFLGSCDSLKNGTLFFRHLYGDESTVKAQLWTQSICLAFAVHLLVFFSLRSFLFPLPTYLPSHVNLIFEFNCNGLKGFFFFARFYDYVL